jgi:hypothetical protein
MIEVGQTRAQAQRTISGRIGKITKLLDPLFNMDVRAANKYYFGTRLTAELRILHCLNVIKIHGYTIPNSHLRAFDEFCHAMLLC